MKTLFATLLLAALSISGQLNAQTFDTFLEYCTHKDELSESKRLTVQAIIDNIAITQMTSLLNNSNLKKLK